MDKLKNEKVKREFIEKVNKILLKTKNIKNQNNIEDK